MKRTAFLIVALLLVQINFAQTTNKKGILYFHEACGGFSLNTNGWNINGGFANVESMGKKISFDFELRSLKNPKEVRQSMTSSITFGDTINPKAFIYGKQNSLFTLSALAGSTIDLGRKADKSGVDVSLKYSAGLSLGMLKPYGLMLIYQNDSQSRSFLKSQTFNEAGEQKFLDWYSIYGGAGFLKGLGKTKFTPGAIAKVSLSFDWAEFDEYIKAIEVGVCLNAFTKKLPVMVVENNQQFYPSMYASIQLGKKW